MPRLPAKQREAEKVATKLPNGSYAAAVNDSPARISWEEHSIRLLQKMSGDRRKRKQCLEKMISALVSKREEFRKEKKTGAGSATEAIEFYQYVLDKNLNWKAKAGKKPSKGNGSDNGSAVIADTADTNDDFLNEHNDVCEVCGIGGELLCCSTCNLVFHLKCVRPALKTMPPDSWSCAHCDATGVTGLKKDNRQRKRALSAIREMNKLTESLKDGCEVASGDNQVEAKTDPKADGSNAQECEKICRICSTGGNTFSCSQSVCQNNFHVSCVRPQIESPPGLDWNCAYCDVDFVTGLKPQARKRRAAISGVRAMEKLKADFDSKRKRVGTNNADTPNKRKADNISDCPTPTHPGQPRSQRLRRQSLVQGEKENLVSPVSTDESLTVEEDAQIIPLPRFTREDIPPDLLKKLSRKVTNSNSRHGQYNCKFCMDDEDAEACCFCACRVCFTKHSKPQTILCDLCDGEYHITCLSPPLAEIPSFEWYCPTCTESIIHAKANGTKSGARTTSGKKSKTKGKSASQTAVKKGSTKAKAAKLAIKLKKAAHSAHQPRTSSGRFASKGNDKPGGGNFGPRGNKKSALLVVKRGPGRPPKSAKKAAIAQRAAISTNNSILSAGKKPMFSSSGGMFATATQQRSRSGRVVKRKAAYDEREEGAQLLIKGGIPNSFSDMEDDTSSNRGNNLNGMPSAAAMFAANSAASIMQKQQGATQDMTNSLLLAQGLPSKEKSSVLVSQKDLVLQHVQPSHLYGDGPLPSPKSHSSKKLFSPGTETGNQAASSSKNPRRKPGARECMQISRRFGAGIIQQNYVDILNDYCSRGKVEHLIRMRERLDEHSRFLESQLAGLESMIQDKERLRLKKLSSNIETQLPKEVATLSSEHGICSKSGNVNAAAPIVLPPPQSQLPPVTPQLTTLQNLSEIKKSLEPALVAQAEEQAAEASKDTILTEKKAADSEKEPTAAVPLVKVPEALKTVQ